MFFGGGTPSLMEPETAGALIARTRELWDTAPDLEITLEANPTSVEAANVRRACRGRRQPRVARRPGARSGGAAVPRARAFGRRGDRRDRDGPPTLRALLVRPDLCAAGTDDGAPGRAELERALALAGEHLSLYQLTIERGTRFFAEHQRGAFELPGEEEAARMFELTQTRLEAAGLPAYEISNHARPGAACRHNLIYWRYQDYVGIGPGAHGRFAAGDTKRATRRASGPENWLGQVEANRATARSRRRS